MFFRCGQFLQQRTDGNCAGDRKHLTFSCLQCPLPRPWIYSIIIARKVFAQVWRQIMGNDHVISRACCPFADRNCLKFQCSLVIKFWPLIEFLHNKKSHLFIKLSCAAVIVSSRWFWNRCGCLDQPGIVTGQSLWSDEIEMAKFTTNTKRKM